jgi:maltooligosyltrehalose trehalohydrolase
MQERLDAPHAPETFLRCKLDLTERIKHAGVYALHKDLLELRKQEPAFRTRPAGGVDGAVLGDQAFAVRFRAGGKLERLMLVNLGRDLHLARAPEPLLAPPEGYAWELEWSSEEPRYGGNGTPAVETADGWRIPGEACVVLRPGMEELPAPKGPAGT